MDYYKCAHAPIIIEKQGEIKLLYANGYKPSEIAEMTGLSHYRVKKILITAGLWENELSKEVNLLWNNNLSVPSIANKLGITTATVHSYLPYRGWTECEIPLNSLSEVFYQFLNQMEINKGPSALQTYKSAYKKYSSTFDTLSKENMVAYRDICLQDHTTGTANHYCGAMNQFCRFLDNPQFCVTLKRFKEIKALENIITVDQYNALLYGLRRDGNIKGYTLIKWMGHIGTRPGETRILNKSCLEKGYQDVTSKSMRRRIYIPRPLIEESMEYFNTVNSNLLFTNDKGFKITSSGLNSQIKRWCVKYGIPKEVSRPYSFRHFFAKQFLKYNSDISLLADLMGHWSLDTTRDYLRKTANEQLAKFEETASKW